jgi:hypothetical protein
MDDHSIDDVMLDRIAAAFERDLPTIPPTLSHAARDAFQWRRADAHLAELLFDSASEELVGIRGGGAQRRSFRYSAGDVVVRAHLSDATLIVMIEPPLSVVCRVTSTTEAGAPRSVEYHTDELGELAVDAPELPARFEFDLPSGTFVTPWITA